MVGFTSDRITIAETILALELEIVASSVSEQPMSVSLTVGSKKTGTTAKKDTDFVAKLGNEDPTTYPTITFAPGETQKKVQIHLRDDDMPEPEETLVVRLTKPMGCTIDRDHRDAEIVIQDNDGFVGSGSGSSGDSGGVLPTTPTEVSFISTDTTTKGNWKQLYGADGYLISPQYSAIPGYAAISDVVGGEYFYLGDGQLEDIYLLKPGENDDRIATGYATTIPGTSLYINIACTNTHKVTAYFVDDMEIGSQDVEILDAAGTLLHKVSLTDFTSGAYISWNMQGAIQLRVSNSEYAIFNGLFFD